ncbi:MAG: lipopolysaccharide biosynthesis protein [Bryobacteraceae bacterium]|nr:lipopolysaccharide biosynthesis protein [Bryobacteraceae bacterium]
MLEALRARLGPAAPVSLTRNAVFSVLSFTITALVAFVVSPLIIHTLGNAPYGLLSMAGELNVQFALLSLGLRSALNFFVARGLARDDFPDLQRTLQSALTILLALAAVGVAALAFLLTRLPYWFNLDGVAHGEARFAIGLLVFIFLAGFPMTVFSSLLAGLRRHDLDNLAMIASSLVSAVLIVVALNWWGTLPAVAVAQALGIVVRWLLQAWLIRRFRRPLRFRPARIDRERARELFTFGAADLVLTLTTAITLQSDLIVVSRILGAAAAGSYHVGRYLGLHFYSLIMAVTVTLGTNFTYHHTKEDAAATRALFLNSSRYISGIACLLAALILAYGEPFIALWVGSRFVDGPFWDSGRGILLFMTLAMLARSMGNVCSQYLLGVRRLRAFVAVRVAEAALSLTGAILLVQDLGLAGVAVAKLGVSVLSHFFFAIPYCCRLLGIPLAGYAQAAVLRPLVGFLGTAAAAWVLRYLLPPAGWLQLLAGGGAAALVGGLIGWAVLLSPAERAIALARMRGITRLN